MRINSSFVSSLASAMILMIANHANATCENGDKKISDPFQFSDTVLADIENKDDIGSALRKFEDVFSKDISLSSIVKIYKDYLGDDFIVRREGFIRRSLGELYDKHIFALEDSGHGLMFVDLQWFYSANLGWCLFDININSNLDEFNIRGWD